MRLKINALYQRLFVVNTFFNSLLIKPKFTMRKSISILLVVLACTLSASAQDRTITGKVTDSKGTPISDVTVLVKGANVGTTTNAAGMYSINVPSTGRALVFTSVGMGVEERSVGNRTVVNAELQTIETSLQEVVVTGVGTATNKKKVAIAVESISAKDLPQVSQGSISQALVGKVAGAQISSTSGQPGQQANILLRGINTLGSTQPMILIDGVQINANGTANGSGTNVSSRLSDIDLSNVERVEVVQGAAAATIYGAQGANGVIQIFTKKGKRDGKLSINLRSSISFDQVLKGNLGLAKNHFYDTDAQGFIVNNAGVKLAPNSVTGVYPLPKQPASLANAVNDKPFLEETFDNIGNVFINNAMTVNNSVTFSGGRERSDFSLTFSHLDQESIVFGDYKRTNLSINMGMELFKNFNMRTITQVAYTDNTTGGITGQNNINSPLGTALNQRQYIDLKRRDSIGNYIAAGTVGQTSINPFYSQQFRNYSSKNLRLIPSINLNYKPFKVLELDYKYSIDNYVNDYRDFVSYQLSSLTPSVGIGPTNGGVFYNNINQTLKNSLLTAFLKVDFAKDLKMNVPLLSTTQLAYDYRKNRILSLNANGVGFPPFPPYTLTGTAQSSSENTTEFATYGYLVNQKFDYGDLFGVSAGFRTDYSSAFGTGSKPFTFPRGDAYLRISEIFNLKQLSEFKLRAAYGKAGIQPGAYDRFIVLNSGNIGSGGYLAVQAGANNPELNVEVSEEFEVGTDISFKVGKTVLSSVKLSATYWKKRSDDVIRALSVAPSTGALDFLTNALSLKSDGFQLSLDANIVKKKNFDWDFGIRFGKSKSIVDKIANGKEIAIGSGGSGEFVLKEGVSVGAFFGLRPLRNVDESNGKGQRYIPVASVGNYEIVNGYVVNKNTKQVEFTTDKEQIGDPNPDFNMTFLNNFTIGKKIGISFQLDWVYGNQIYNQTRQWLYADFLSEDFDVPVTIGGVSKPYVNYYNSLYKVNGTNSHFVEDGSFLRMRDITFSHSLDVSSLKYLKEAKIAFSARNLFTITKYSGMDPEASASFNNPIRRGVDLYSFPNFRTYQISLNLGF